MKHESVKQNPIIQCSCVSLLFQATYLTPPRPSQPAFTSAQHQTCTLYIVQGIFFTGPAPKSYEDGKILYQKSEGPSYTSHLAAG